MQEAYCPPCSEYSFCCPTWVPSPGGYPVRYPPLGGSGYPPRGVWVPPWGVWVPPRGGLGTPRGVGGTRSGTPLGGTRSGTPPGGSGYPPGGTRSGTPPGGTRSGTPPGGYPPTASWHSGKCCKALWDMGTPPRCGQTNKVKLLPSRRTTYAGGNNHF